MKKKRVNTMELRTLAEQAIAGKVMGALDVAKLASPETVLELCDEVDRLEAHVDSLAQALSEAQYGY